MSFCKDCERDDCLGGIDCLAAAVVDQKDAISSNGSCERCGKCGSAETYANQVMMPLQGKVRCIDWCIHQIVAALNAGGVETVACCCGHGAEQGRIDLADGRILRIETPS
ncbi:hypothetical protein NCG89_00935 [Spongiibacter taiwanensis]|uniref:hypothetical protein n=1 Tax=Spongiibacter taiwanensis TaxID=1748242 RepID=UPI0020360A89|nr:hypothetical protein [Spongiibacter taiwanensis]USA43368.1 hypothetical protein NCG89_00935 [Spongiibacter taiwanensis]